jgi:hypothetical protein
MKFYLFLRSIIWTSVLAILLVIASIVALIISPTPTPSITLGLAALTLATLAPRRSDY